MNALYVLGVLAVATMISGIVDSALGLYESDLVYDWQAETMVFKPSKQDILLDMLIRG